MNDIKLLKRQLTKYKRKYNAELQANKSLIDANTTLVDKDRILMFEINILKEERERLNNIINELQMFIEDERFKNQYAFDEFYLPIIYKLKQLKDSDK